MSEILLSHPDQKLAEHIKGMHYFSLKCIEERKFTGWREDDLKEALIIAVFFHDFAKSTSYFQEYIRSKEKRKNPLNSHTLLSAISSYYIAKQLRESKGDFSLHIPVFLFAAVRRHHCNLNPFQSLVNQVRSNVNVLLNQAQAICYTEWSKVLDELCDLTPSTFDTVLPINQNKVEKWVSNFINESRKIRSFLRRSIEDRSTDHVENYYRFSVLYSVLLDADKNQAALREQFRIGRKDFPTRYVDVYKKKQNWPTSYLNGLREEAFQEVTRNVRQVEGKLFSIQLPTGMGKTLTAIKAALELRERRARHGYIPRIIYTLPFLSVIEQNYQVIENVLHSNQVSPHSALLMKHHSLVDPYEMIKDEDEEYNLNQSEILLEGWNSEVVCTTYVQFFQSLISHRNRALRKFHRFSHAIIILDEVQSIPTKYWSLMRKMLLELTSGMNSDVLLLTATEPKIFNEDDLCIPLCERKKYFRAMDRLKIYPQLNTKQTVEELLDTIDVNGQKSYLFILNTIQSAKDTFHLLKNRTKESIGFLSTHIPPKERLNRIEQIKTGKYRIVVSTQLVEAGVDIDFEVVYRDFAPLDSINQSAGRCNRNGRTQGSMHIVHLWNGCRGSYAKSIYEAVKLNTTLSVLKDKDTISEAEFLNLIDTYFKKIKEISSQSEARKLLNGVKTLYYTGEKQDDRIPIQHFQLIEQTYEKIDVFIELDEDAIELWKHYESIQQIEKLSDKYHQFAKIKKSFQEYIVSIPLKVENRPPIVCDHFYVGYHQLADYYDRETGFITQGVNPIW